MPELPDVEVFRGYMDATSLHQDIQDVEIKSDQILRNLTAKKLKMRLIGHKFESTKRHGKHLFAGLDVNQWLMMHFGMTGFLKHYKSEEEKPSHIRLLITFTNGYHLAFDCQRKLGEIDLTKEINQYIKNRNLGPDVLSGRFDFSNFKQALARSRAMIKSVLMDQERMAGIGNIYADEILFQAGVHPKTKVNKINDGELKGIYENIKWVLNEAISNQVDPSKMPDSFLLPHRDQGGRCPKCGSEIKKLKVSGRSAYFCPNCQYKK